MGEGRRKGGREAERWRSWQWGGRGCLLPFLGCFCENRGTFLEEGVSGAPTLFSRASETVRAEETTESHSGQVVTVALPMVSLRLSLALPYLTLGCRGQAMLESLSASEEEVSPLNTEITMRLLRENWGQEQGGTEESPRETVRERQREGQGEKAAKRKVGAGIKTHSHSHKS